MCLLAVALLVAFVPELGIAADKNEEKAKETAVAFLKAVKAKDADAVVKLSAAPFAHREGGDISVLKDEDSLKKWVKERLEDLKDADKVPTEIEKMVPFADFKDKIPDENDRKKVEEIVGKDGFVAMISFNGTDVVMLIRIKDDKAKVVGIGY